MYFVLLKYVAGLYFVCVHCIIQIGHSQHSANDETYGHFMWAEGWIY